MRGRRTAVALAVAGLLFAACGGDDDGDATADTTAADAADTTAADTTDTTAADATDTTAADTTDTTAADTTDTTTAQPASGEPVKVMVISPITSPASSFPDTPLGAQAAADSINARGGISGRPIEIVVCDDQRDPAVATACAQQAIDEGVIAVTGTILFGAQVLPLLEEAGIPIIGGSIFSSAEWVSENVFPLNGGSPAQWLTLGAAMAEQGYTKMAAARTDSAAADNGFNALLEGIELGGGELVGEPILTVAGAPDFAPYAATALASQPDALLCVCATNDTVKFILAARQQGFEGPIGFTTNIFAPDIVETLGDAGSEVWAASYQTLDADGLAVGQYAEDLATYTPQVTATGSSTTVTGWEAIVAIAQVLDGQDTLDAATLKTSLVGATIDFAGSAPNVALDYPGPDPTRPRVPSWEVIIYSLQDGEVAPVIESFDPFAS